MTMRSVPSTTERLSGEASTSMGKHFAGRRLAKRSSSFRIRSRPRSGRTSCGRLSHLGPPTEPNRMASACWHSRRAASGSGPPVASMAAPPTWPISNSKLAPVALPTTSRTRRASGVTSWPMPSPGRNAILCTLTSRLLVVSVRVPRRLLRRQQHVPAARPQGTRGAAEEIRGEEGEEEPLRVGGDDQHTEDHEEQESDGAPLREVDLLEAVVAERGDHEQGDEIGPDRDQARLPALELVTAHEQ